MKRYLKWSCIPAGSLMIVGIVAVLAVSKEERVTIEQVPAQAREALLKLAGGAQIKEIEKDVENGVEVYEATWIVDSKEHEAAVTTDGRPFQENEADEDDEAKITMDQVPPKAREALLKLAGNEKITEVTKENEDGAMTYEAEWTVQDNAHGAAVTEDGVLLELEETLNIKDVPESVRKAAEKLLAGAEKMTFEKEMKIVYEVSGTVNGKKKEVKISPAGLTRGHKGKHKDVNKDKDDDDDHEDKDDDKDNNEK